ncbi:MAG: 7TM diverse intracellular signaling domain-containing protein, partial [Pseudomonadota bacterium]
GWRKLQVLSRDLKPFPQPSRYAVFLLPNQPGRVLTFYLRLQSTSVNSMDPRIYSQVGFLDYNRGQLWLLGAYCGAILALAIYNLVMFFSLKDRSYLWYVLTITSLALYYLGWNGLFQDYMHFLPVGLNRHLPIAFLSVLFLCRGQFARYFLLTNERAPVSDRIILVYCLVMAFITIMVPLSSGGLRLLAINSSALGSLCWAWLLIIIVWLRWRQGFKPALYFLLFYLPTAVGQLISMLTILRVLPFSDTAFFSHQIASYFEPILLALALGYRIRSMRREKQGAEQAAREIETRHRQVMEAAPDPIAVCDERGLLNYVNPAFERVFGWSAESVLGRDMGGMLFGEPPGGADFPGGVMASGRVQNWEARLLTSQGPEIDIQVSAAALAGSQGRPGGLVLIMQDIRNRKRSEAEKAAYEGSLRQLALELSSAEERERRRLAGDLHDGVSQTLAASVFSLKSLRARLQGEPKEELSRICADMDESLRGLRSLTFEISPPVLYDYGLAAALEWLASHSAGRYGFAVEFSETGDTAELDQERQVNLYRACRELMVNVAKHANAKKVHIELNSGNGVVTLSVADDGKGFDPAGLAKGAKSNMGLFSLRERLQPLGGSLSIESQAGLGSRISLSLPLASPPSLS